MNPSARAFPLRIKLAVAAAAAASALAALALAPDAADAGKSRDRGLFAVAELEPMPGQTVRGVAHLRVKPGASGIIAILIGLAADPNDPSGDTYALRMSKRSCAALARNPAQPRFVGPDLLAGAELKREGTSGVWDDTDIVHLTRARLRGVKSLAVTSPGVGGGAHACGRLGIIEEEGIFYFSR